MGQANSNLLLWVERDNQSFSKYNQLHALHVSDGLIYLFFFFFYQRLHISLKFFDSGYLALDYLSV